MRISNGMKIGVFDSGLGGLFILKSLAKKLPRYDYFYLGDTKRLPYGNRSNKVIYEYTRNAVDFMLRENCQLIILACNSASSVALRKIQEEYLPRHYPKRRVLGVVIPTIEEAAGTKAERIGVLATSATVNSNVFKEELEKINPKIKIFQEAAPLLVPLIEEDSLREANIVLKFHLKVLLGHKVEAIILGCTHYPILKKEAFRLSRSVRVISQDEIMPEKLVSYLARHPEIEEGISKNGQLVLAVTDITPHFKKTARRWFGQSTELKLVDY